MKPLAFAALLLTAVPSLAAQPDSFDMVVVDSLPFFEPYRLVCGDANRNGRPEFYAHLHHCPFYVYALEWNGSGFDSTRLNFQTSVFWAFGDADRDGKAELLSLNDYVWYLHERSPGSQFPETCVWQNPGARQAGPHEAAITDLDADSSNEIIITEPYWGNLLVFECIGDNTFSFRDSLRALPAGLHTGLCQADDLDRDGKPELLSGTERDYMLVYESVADDSFICVWKRKLLETGRLLSGIAFAPDMDRDGRPEAIAFGVEYHDEGKLYVLESPCDDSLEVVWEGRTWGRYVMLGWRVAVGDVDGDGVPEFALTDGRCVRLYRCTGADEYEEIWQAECYYEPVTLYDIDWDGKCELLYCQEWSTVIRKYVPGGVAEGETEQLRAVEASPSVLRPGEGLNLSGLPPDAKVELLDVSGRVRAGPDLTLGIGDLSLRPGAYFVRISSGSQSITRKVLVVD